jgi:hypothetical protein
MSKKLGVIVIHGMGETKADYYFGLQEHIAQTLGTNIWSQVHLEPIFYQDLLQPNQYRVWNQMVQKEVLDWKGLRQFMLFSFADASTLEHKPEKEGSVYHKVQHKIVNSLRKTRVELGNQDRDIILVAQSLGGQVISNYIWDFQNNLGIWQPNNPDFPEFNPEEENFLKFKSLRYLFTSGCNIPLFVSGFDQIKAVEKPNENFKWLNYYDKDDVLGWPLKPLSDSYNQVVEEDREIDAGNLFLQGWNPFSHTGYWTDRDFVKPLCDKIQSLL